MSPSTTKRSRKTAPSKPHVHNAPDVVANIRGSEPLANDARDQHRQKFAQIALDSMVQFVALLDSQGAVLEISRSALDGAGIQISDVEGRPFCTAFWWQVSDEINAALRDAIRRASEGESVRWDTEIYRRAGRKDTTSIEASLMPVKDKQGRVSFITFECRDLTEKKALEREIARQREELAVLDLLKTKLEENDEAMRAALISSQHLAAIVQSSDDGIVSKDLNGIVTSWNAGAQRIFGYTSEEIIGLPITTIIPPDLIDDEPVILGKIRRGERIDHFQTTRQTKSGERIDVSLTISPIKDVDGNVIGASKIVRDITQQKKLERALHVTEQLASVGRLAATVAHEINNPLESVTNFIFLAKTSPNVPDDLRRYLDSADEELSRVAHIARQTLGFYRDNSRPVWVGISDAVNDVMSVYQRKLEYKGLKAAKEIDENLKLYTLEGELKQILANLIANAIDASQDAGRILVRARHRIHMRHGKPGVTITVADTGSGIAPEDRERLFLPFFTTKKEVGTGLGLWITKELIRKAGGHLRLKSRQGAGTAMMIFMPLQPISAEQVLQ